MYALRFSGEHIQNEYTRVFHHNLSIAVLSNKGSRKTLTYHT